MLAKAHGKGLHAKTLVQDPRRNGCVAFLPEEEAGYRVIKPLRDMVIFARQNLASDPPFSRMDLISCRNLLIYLEPDVQKKILSTFLVYASEAGRAFIAGRFGIHRQLNRPLTGLGSQAAQNLCQKTIAWPRTGCGREKKNTGKPLLRPGEKSFYRRNCRVIRPAPAEI